MRSLKRCMLLLGLLVLLCVPALAIDTMPSAEIAVTVDEKGQAAVTATIDLELENQVTTLTLPVGQQVKDAAVRGYDDKTVTDNGFVSLELTGNFSGKQQFVLTYTAPTEIKDTADGQTWRVELLSARWPYPVEALSYSLTMPKAYSGVPTLESGYYGQLAPAQVVTNQTDNGASGAVTYAMLDHESMALVAALPADFFPGSGPVFGSGFPWQLVQPILLLLAAAYYFFFLRCALPQRLMCTQLPEPVTAGDVPAVLWGGDADTGALLARWGGLGYLRVDQDRAGRPVLVRKMAMGNERRAEEQRAFDRLFGDETACVVGSRRQRMAMESGGKLLGAYWRRRLFDRSSGNPAVLGLLGCLAGAVTMGRIFVGLFGGVLSPILWAIVGALLGVAASVVILRGVRALLRRRGRDLAIGAAVLVLLFFVLGRFAKLPAGAVVTILQLAATGAVTAFGGRRTKAGVEQLSRVLGYRRYLATLEPRVAARMVRANPQYFYETLPAADALGVGGKFTAKFAGLPLERCSWMPSGGTAEQFYARYRALYAALHGEPAPTSRRGKKRRPQTRRGNRPHAAAERKSV